MPLAKIGQHDARAWVAELGARDLAASTVQRAYQLLSKVMAAAVDAGMIPRTPCRRVPLPKIDRQEMRFLSPQEVARLAAAIRPDYRALILLGAYGGLRIGEMAGLRCGRVDLAQGTVQVVEVVTEPTGKLHIGPPKTQAARRTVGLPQFVVEALAERMGTLGSPEDFVFAGPKGGVLRVSTFRSRFWRSAVIAAGLQGIRIHDLRHTAVALWIAAGANPKGDSSSGRARLRQLHARPLRPSLPRGRPGATGAPPGHLRRQQRRIVAARGPSAAPSDADRPQPPPVGLVARR